MTHEYATLVVKYGGNAMAAPASGQGDPLLAELASRWEAGEAVVLIHGGGPEIDAALTLRGITTARIAGQRVTGDAALAVTEAVLCGSINKRIVRELLALGVRAAGVSGQDAGTLIARRASGENGEDLGFVGEIVTVDTRLIATLLTAGYLPVVAPLAVAPRADHAYNVNADLAAGALAAALGARAFVLVTNVPRVLRDLDDPTSGIARLTADEAASFARSNACRSSMKPKLLAAANAVRDGAAASYICGAKPNAIASALRGDATIVSPP
ncbi:MAG: acetylglutamate kinase [Candidatus Cybelea sp.]